MSLVLEEITVAYGKKNIVEAMNLEVRQGELVVLLGLNGAGKTTLMKAAAGLRPLASGMIRVDDVPLKSLSARQRAQKIAYVPQQMALALSYSVEDFIMMGLTPYLKFWQTPKVHAKKCVSEVLHKLQIEGLKTRLMHELSGGERQLVYLARSLIQKASIMILDEPTASLDFKRQHELMQLLSQIKKEEKQAILVSLHDPNLALAYADRIAVIHKQHCIGIFSCHMYEGSLQKETDIAQKAILMELLKTTYGPKARLSKANETVIVYDKERGDQADDSYKDL